MSYHSLTPLETLSAWTREYYTIAVGWNPTSGCYFAFVNAPNDDPIGYETGKVSIGNHDGITDPQAIIEAVRPYAIIPDDLIETLTADRAREGIWHPDNVIPFTPRD